MVNAAQARLRRDRSIDRAEQGQLNFDADWLEESLSILAAWAPGRGPFLAEDFLQAGVIRRPREPRAMGALFRAAAKRGLVRRVGYAAANTSNRGIKCQWQSQ